MNLDNAAPSARDRNHDRAKPGTRGGKREGAGRPKKKNKLRRDPLHRTRPEFPARYPQHVVLRTCRDVPRLRRGKIYRAIRKTLGRMLGMLGFQVVHVSIQHNHLHFLVEAAGKEALRVGMQGLAISAAKAINKVTKHKGKVFEYRYHATSITSPRQARNALAYVLRGSTRIGRERARHIRWSLRCAPSKTTLLRSAMSPRVMRPFVWAFPPHGPANDFSSDSAIRRAS